MGSLKPTRIYSNKNIYNFNKLLLETDFSAVYSLESADAAYDYFIKLYLNAHDTAFPFATYTQKNKYIKKSPWITAGLVQSSVTKSKLLVRKLKSPSQENHNKYKQYRSIYNRLLRKSKAIYYHEKLQLTKYDMKQTWKCLKSVLNKNDERVELPRHFRDGNNIIKDKGEIADNFNKYFANIGNEISNTVSHALTNCSDYFNPRNPHSIYLDPVTPSDIITATRNIKTKTSRDFEGLNTKLLKGSITNIIEPITYIVNSSLSTGVVPHGMKIAKVIPIFKKGDRTHFNNNRPISILPVFSKIMEKIVTKRLLKFLENSSQFYIHQYGFRPGHSTIHPIIHALNQTAVENDTPTKNLTIATFIDLSKAFDIISHEKLLQKLNNMGIRGLAND